jgi:hypothetical protein
MKETYFYGQGKVYSRPYGSTDSGGWRWWGDVSALTFGGTEETASHKESYSGMKAKVREFSLGVDYSLTATLHQIDADALALVLRGTVSAINSGSVTAEALGALAAGDVIKLAHPYRVSSLVITDSAGTPATLAPANYDLNVATGSLEILNVPAGLTAPFFAAYQYAGGRQVSFMTAPPKDVEFRYEGINLAENNAPVIVEFYRVSTQMLQELALITSGNDVAGMEFNAAPLLDGSKPANGALGQYGRFIEVIEA